MADEIETQEPGGQGDNDTPKADHDKDARRRKALSERAQKAEARVKELESQHADLSSKMEDLQDQLDGKSGSIEKTIERKDKEIARLKADYESLSGEFDSFKVGARRDKFVNAVHSEIPNVPLARLEGLIAVAQQRDSTFDAAPEDVDAHTIKSAIKALKQIDPTTFETATAETGKPRTRPGPAPREHTNNLGAGESSLNAFAQNLADSPLLKPKDDRPF